MTLRDYAKNQVASLDINDLTTLEPWASSPESHTDIKRLRQGKMGAQVKGFCVSYITTLISYFVLPLKSFGPLMLVAQLSTKVNKLNCRSKLNNKRQFIYPLKMKMQ